jgi:putative drug exporter of the RND superfamily
MLKRLALWSIKHRKAVVACWVLLAVGLVVAGGSLAGKSSTGSVPSSDAAKANDLLSAAFPGGGGDSAMVVFADPAGVDSHRTAVATAVSSLTQLADVAAVSEPWTNPDNLSADKTVGLVSINFVNFEDDRNPSQETLDAIQRIRSDLEGEGLTVGLSGYWFSEGGMPASELVGIAAAIVILLFAFGSVVAMGLPILTALVGLAIGLSGVGIWANFVAVPDFAPQVAAMIGLGVGIDYALLIVTRYREALHRTGAVQASIVEAMATSGHAVVLAGGTVIISLLGMVFIGLEMMSGLGIASATAVVISVGAAVTLLPALLAMIGKRIERLSIHRRRKNVVGDANAVSPFWTRWSHVIQRRPRLMAAAGLAVLLALAAPLLSLRMASSDAGNDPAGTTTKVAYDLVSQGFGPGVNGPLLLAIPKLDTNDLDGLTTVLSTTKNIASVIGPDTADNGTSVITIIPTEGPQAASTTSLVHQLRDEVIPAHVPGAHVGGQTAFDVDFSDLMSSRLPVFIGAVLIACFILLLVMFRSLLVPLKAVLMNLASIAAAYGLMVAVFQWGWFGLAEPGPIEPWAPMMLFAIVFGLSMDYEVFLLSAIKERFDRTGDSSRSVAEGLASTARVITAAAAIMVFVFGSFILAEVRALRLIGFGLASAVIIDATIVRLVLVPATMELLGSKNWWLPKPLARLVPRMKSLEHAA